jgi:tRNA isopentenyl-2-thiomethyl-A-37 hydroxylase MiaE
LDEFARWQQDARAQAQAGALSWSEFYKQSFDRLTAMSPSLQQDTQLENTVLLLSTARKFEAAEMSAQQFAQEREHIETRLEARLR